jgi:outer membrane protein OmpA-like peptidoglycan-associated protein
MKTVWIGGLTMLALGLAACAKPPSPQPQVYLLFFHPASAALTPEASTIIGQAVAAVKTHHPGTVAVAGYADSFGAPAQNKALAEQRVKIVRDAMVAQGVDPKLFLSIPLGPANDDAGAPGDRRIEIRLTYGP